MSINLPTAEPIARLIEEFSKLPGIGPKSAQRLTYYLLQTPAEKTEALAKAILELKQNLSLCSVCFNITDTAPCAICRDMERDHSKICIVEEPADILPLERTKKYQGVYHVLHGVIAPSDGIGPDELKIKELMAIWNPAAHFSIIKNADHFYIGKTNDLKNILKQLL